MSESLKRAKKKYAQKILEDPELKEKRTYQNARSTARNFISKKATTEDLAELSQLIYRRKSDLEKL